MAAEALVCARQHPPQFPLRPYKRRCLTPGGAELPVGKWLRAMVEYEVHHRGQFYLY